MPATDQPQWASYTKKNMVWTCTRCGRDLSSHTYSEAADRDYCTDLPAAAQPDLDAIRQRAEAATPGPWVLAADLGGSVAILDEDGAVVTLGQAELGFIAHARADVPALLDEIERLTEQRNTLHRLHQNQTIRERDAKLRRSSEQAEHQGVLLALSGVKSDRDQAIARLDAVRALHKPTTALGLCGHVHQHDEPGVIDDEGYTCEQRPTITVCSHCCVDRDGDYINPGCGGECYPCETLRALDGESTKDGA